MCKFFKHLGTVLKHKAVVFKHCCKCGIGWQGFWHDMSKFSFTEFSESVKYYTNGTRSPLSICREKNGYSLAWIHHKGRNKHHLEYWYDEHNKQDMIVPYKYCVEGLCDRIAANKIYNKKNYTAQAVLDYWNKEKLLLHVNPKIEMWFDKVLLDLVNLGEKLVLNKTYLRDQYNKIVNS